MPFSQVTPLWRLRLPTTPFYFTGIFGDENEVHPTPNVLADGFAGYGLCYSGRFGCTAPLFDAVAGLVYCFSRLKPTDYESW